jgi:hypothetical protein
VRSSGSTAVGLIAAWLVALAALTCACTVNIDGRPVASPGQAGSFTEPSFPTPRPTLLPRPTSTAPPPSPSSPTGVPPAAGSLPPSASGYVYIETKSGETRCQLTATEVDCEAQFTNSPVVDGEQANGVSVTSGGTLRWVVGNLGDIPVTTLDYRTYQTLGWTIVAGSDGTRFTKDSTGHGMFVSLDGVEAF